MMARASSGLDVDGAEDLTGLARRWTSTRRAQLRSLPVFIIGPEMADVCIAAALTLSTSDTTDASSADFPAGRLDRMAEKEQQHVGHVSGSVIVDDEGSFVRRPPICPGGAAASPVAACGVSGLIKKLPDACQLLQP